MSDLSKWICNDAITPINKTKNRLVKLEIPLLVKLPLTEWMQGIDKDFYLNILFKKIK